MDKESTIPVSSYPSHVPDTFLQRIAPWSLVYPSWSSKSSQMLTMVLQAQPRLRQQVTNDEICSRPVAMSSTPVDNYTPRQLRGGIGKLMGRSQGSLAHGLVVKRGTPFSLVSSATSRGRRRPSENP